MAETSRSQVTITLGRSGQVVKRGGGAVLDTETVGTKRSVRDRLGDSLQQQQLHNKRLRGDKDSWNLKPNNCFDDLHLSKDDLRFKIMKRTQNNTQQKQNMVDLRDMLSRSPRSSTTSLNETRHGRHRVPEARHMRMPQPRHETPEPRDDRPCGPVYRDERHRMADGMPEPHEVRNRVRDVRPIGSRYTPMRTSEHMGFLGNSNSSWTLDHIRRKSPDRVVLRGLSPQRRRGPYEDSRSVAHGSRDDSQISRSVGPITFIPKQSLSVKTAPTLAPAVNLQRSQYPVEHVTVEGFLHSLGLDKYLISFKVEEVDMAALSQMRDQDLKELGIPMGPRKKIILALLARTRRQAR